MRVFLFVPASARPSLLRILFRGMARRHPEMSIVGPIPERWAFFLDRYQIPIINPPPLPEKPDTFWGKVLWWWGTVTRRPWEPLVEADVVMVFWDSSPKAKAVLNRAKELNKKVLLYRW